MSMDPQHSLYKEQLLVSPAGVAYPLGVVFPPPWLHCL
jgi:hypothetical protein